MTTPVRAESLQLQLYSDFSPKAITVDGVNGVWFPPADAEYLLKLRIDIVPSLVDVVNQQTRTISGLDLQLKLSSDKDRLQQEKLQILQDSYNKSQSDLQACMSKPDHWYNNKYLWGMVGFVSGILITGYVVSAAK